MTISEVEVLLKIDRAKIRYYENQGLIEVERGENNYRDYSEKVVDELKKIILLRSIDVGIADIKKIQSGELSLEYVLTERSKTIGTQQNELEKIRRVCDYVVENEVEYSAFDVDSITENISLSFLNDFNSNNDDKVCSLPLPWQRFFARDIDFLIYGLISTFFLEYVMVYQNVIVANLLQIALMLIFEPLLLSTFGTTIGKACFGLKLRNADGTKLSYAVAFIRLIDLFWNAYRLFIPIWCLVQMYRSYTTCLDCDELSWDNGCSYVQIDRKIKRGVSVALAYLMIFISAVAVFSLINLPRNLGELTTQEFIENYNTYMKYNKDDNYILNENGDMSRETIDIASGRYKFTETDGKLSKIVVEYNGNEPIYECEPNIAMIYNSWISAKNFKMITTSPSYYEDKIIPNLFQNCSYQIDEYKITNEIEYKGYREFLKILIKEENTKEEDRFIHHKFTIEKVA
ncbi:MAG: MerR family transcriptional regulator [Clostridia bacterium]